MLTLVVCERSSVNSVCRGYINDAPATAATFSSDGWLRTGDIMRVDADGDFWVTDRLKEVCLFLFLFLFLFWLLSNSLCR